VPEKEVVVVVMRSIFSQYVFFVLEKNDEFRGKVFNFEYGNFDSKKINTKRLSSRPI